MQQTSPPAVPPELFVDSVQAAEILDLDERTVRRGIKAGDIPAVRIGRRWRIPTAWLRRAAGQEPAA